MDKHHKAAKRRRCRISRDDPTPPRHAHHAQSPPPACPAVRQRADSSANSLGQLPPTLTLMLTIGFCQQDRGHYEFKFIISDFLRKHPDSQLDFFSYP